jgi:GH15 family glucan-1,4-alpha-glucosidase
VDRIEAGLVAEGGGVHRYRGDRFYGGGLWLPLAGALSWIHAELGNAARAAQVLAWMEAAANKDGTLPEQVSRHLLAPGHLRPWVDRWGPVATPLLWSHAMYLIARAKMGA